MAENINANKQSYLQGDRSVGLNKYLENRKKADTNQLDGIDIRQRAKSLGKNDFLRLLAKQLSHQDPTKPMKDTQFIAQMAQFSALEQMSNISQSMTKMGNYQAVNLVGKTVIGRDFNSSQQVTGLTKAVFFDQQGTPFLRTTGGIIKFSDVLSIIETPQPAMQQSGVGRPAAQSAAAASVATSPGAAGSTNPAGAPGAAVNVKNAGDGGVQQVPAAGEDGVNGAANGQAQGKSASTVAEQRRAEYSGVDNVHYQNRVLNSGLNHDAAGKAGVSRSLPGLKGKFRPVTSLNGNPASVTTSTAETLNEAQEAGPKAGEKANGTKNGSTAP